MGQQRSDAAGPFRRVTAVLLFTGFLLLYLATFSPVVYVYDGLIMFLMTESIVEDGDLLIEDPVAPHHNTPYAVYGLGQPLVAVPLYLLGRASFRAVDGPPGPMRWMAAGLIHLVGADATSRESVCISIVHLLNPLATAAAVVIVMLIGRQLRFSPARALLPALACGAGTFAWTYTKYFYSEPLAMLLLLLSVLGAMMVTRGPGAWLPILSGVAAGALVVVRPASAVALPWILGYLLLAAPRRNLRSALARVFGFGLGAAPFAALQVWYNLLRFDVPFVTTYPGHDFGTPVLVGLFGLLLSPGRGLLVYAPIVLIGLFAFGDFLREHRSEAILFGGVAASHLIVYAKWDQWSGGGSWGPRFLLPVLPLLLLPIGRLWPQPGGGGTRRVALTVVLVMAALMQLLAVSADYTHYQRKLRRHYGHMREWALHWAPETCAWIGQWELVAEGALDIRAAELNPASGYPRLSSVGRWLGVAIFCVGSALFWSVAAPPSRTEGGPARPRRAPGLATTDEHHGPDRPPVGEERQAVLSGSGTNAGRGSASPADD